MAALFHPITADIGVLLQNIHVHPSGQGFIPGQGHIPLLKEHDVHAHFRPGVGEGGIVGQADRAQQVAAAGDVLPRMAVFFVHGAASDAVGGDKSDHAASPNFVDGFGKEIVMNQEVFSVIAPVCQLIAAEGDIADGEVEETVREVAFFKALDGDIGLGVKLLGDTARLNSLISG